MTEAAGIVGDTLLTLREFRVERSILDCRVHSDLGISYALEVTPKQATGQVTANWTLV